MQIPASYVVRNKLTKEVEFETFDYSLVLKLNTEKYEAIPILDYLVELNRKQENRRVV